MPRSLINTNTNYNSFSEFHPYSCSRIPNKSAHQINLRVQGVNGESGRERGRKRLTKERRKKITKNAATTKIAMRKRVESQNKIE